MNSCQDVCQQSPASVDALPKTNTDAAANVSLHCVGMNVMMIKYDPGIFIVEQSKSENTWAKGFMISGGLVTFRNLVPGASYRYRVYRFTRSGVSRPEISDWFTTYKVNYKPVAVKNLYLSKLEVEEHDVCFLRAEITFQPAEDRSCTYNVLSWSGEHNLVHFQLREVPEFRFYLKNLEYRQNTSVEILSSNEDNSKISGQTSTIFHTPSCLEMHNNLSICAPERIEGLRVENTYTHGASNELYITWDRPTRDPDNYTIQIESPQIQDGVYYLNIPGNLTEVRLTNVKLGHQYEVSIVAESVGGISPTSYIAKSVTKEDSDPDLSYYQIGIVLPTIATILLLTGMICIWYHRQKSMRRGMEYIRIEAIGRKETTEVGGKSRWQNYASNSPDVPAASDKFELDPRRLKLKGILGSGACGIVRLGSLKNEHDEPMDVAVKMLKDNPNIEDLKNFYREISIMKSAGQHSNIVSLIGCCTLKTKPVLVVEYCSKGDLQNYLRTIWEAMVNAMLDHRARYSFGAKPFGENDAKRFSNIVGREEPSYQNDRTICNRLYDIQRDAMQSAESVTAADLLNFARQVATGMEFLSSNKIVHRDLAARNVLVCEDKIIKISDFGLSRDIYQENVYKKQGNGKLPLKWMAIEALTHQIYTSRSDVWSFGILLWEIVTMGASPYPGVATDKILKLLKSGYRMERPPNCDIELYNVMLSCWNARPQARPTFAQLKCSLDKLLCTHSANKYLNVCELLGDRAE
ncbi:hypothetical protein KM043_000521 [Ampulex compressa]|nr:hypothetical protein KM043_000521 [Ampulex compressa]